MATLHPWFADTKRVSTNLATRCHAEQLSHCHINHYPKQYDGKRREDLLHLGVNHFILGCRARLVRMY